MKAKTKILMLLVPAALAASLLATPVEAHDKRHHRQSAAQHHRAHGHHGHKRARAHRHDRFRIPARIHRHDARRFRGYFRTREYFRPHRHRHDVYDFPVWSRRGYVYRSHHYCDGALFSGGRIEYHGRRVSFGIDF